MEFGRRMRETILHAQEKRRVAETLQVKMSVNGNNDVQMTKDKPVKHVRMHPSDK